MKHKKTAGTRCTGSFYAVYIAKITGNVPPAGCMYRLWMVMSVQPSLIVYTFSTFL